MDPYPYTFSAWIKLNQYSSDTNTGSVVLNNYDGADSIFYISNTGKLSIRPHPGTDLKGNTVIPLNTWTHIATTLEGTNLKVYVNGVLDGGITSSGYAGGTSKTMTIGKASWFNGSYFNGAIDEVHISNIARSSSDIRQAYEISRRSHPITIDFVNSLNASDLITASSDLSFAVNDATYLYLADKVIIKENIGGTEYVAQATVNTKAGNTITVASWDSGSTFPSSGYTANATAIKWQRNTLI